jgi:hypothetical protein
MQLLVAMNVIKIIILQHILFLHLWIYEVTCYNERAAKSSFCSTFFFFIFGSMKLLVAMNVIKIITLQHILFLHLWIYEVTCCNECDQNHHFAAHSFSSSLDL